MWFCVSLTDNPHHWTKAPRPAAVKTHNQNEKNKTKQKTTNTNVVLDSAGGHVNDKWQLRGDAHTVWSSPLSIWSAAAWILWHKKCHLAIYERNAGRVYTHTYTHMCGLTAHAVQLREFGSIFSRQKQHAHRKKKKKREKESTYKTISLGSLQCPQRRGGEILEGKKNSEWTAARTVLRSER